MLADGCGLRYARPAYYVEPFAALLLSRSSLAAKLCTSRYMVVDRLHDINLELRTKLPAQITHSPRNVPRDYAYEGTSKRKAQPRVLIEQVFYVCLYHVHQSRRPMLPSWQRTLCAYERPLPTVGCRSELRSQKARPFYKHITARYHSLCIVTPRYPRARQSLQTMLAGQWTHTRGSALGPGRHGCVSYSRRCVATFASDARPSAAAARENCTDADGAVAQGR